MPQPTNQEVVEEIKKLNSKIDKLIEGEDKPKGFSTPLAITALFLGYVILGPIVSMIIMTLFN